MNKLIGDVVRLLPGVPRTLTVCFANDADARQLSLCFAGYIHLLTAENEQKITTSATEANALNRDVDTKLTAHRLLRVACCTLTRGCANSLCPHGTRYNTCSDSDLSSLSV